MNLRGFAIDVDGTLTDLSGELELEGVHALRHLARLGYPIILVSARSAWEVWFLSRLVGVTGTVVAENGGVVATSPVDLHLLGDRAVALEGYGILANRINNVVLKKVVPHLTDVVLERTFQAAEAKKVLEDATCGSTLWDTGFSYIIAKASVNKAAALKLAGELLVLDPKEIVAVGDGENDIPLFQACGYSLALGNAPDPVKAAAKHAVASSYGAGLVEALRHVATCFMKVELRL